MSLLFLLASLGVINGFIVGTYIIVRKNRSIQDVFFGGLLLVLCIRIGKSVFFYFNRDTDFLILQIGLSACAFIGPFFSLYTKSLYRQQTSIRKTDIILLTILCIAIIVVGVIYPYRSYSNIWNDYIIYCIYAVWVAFVGVGSYFCVKLLGKNTLMFWKLTGKQQYLFATMIAIISITTTYALALLGYFTYIWGSLIFSFSFYYLIVRLFLDSRTVTPKPQNIELANGDELLTKLNRLMSEQKPFTKQGLKLDELATKADMSRHLLSQILNETYRHGFAHYLKEYRVNEAKELIATRPELSLEGIGYEAGFSSKSSFFDAFKKITNSTPAAYKKSLEVA